MKINFDLIEEKLNKEYLMLENDKEVFRNWWIINRPCNRFKRFSLDFNKKHIFWSK